MGPQKTGLPTKHQLSLRRKLPPIRKKRTRQPRPGCEHRLEVSTLSPKIKGVCDQMSSCTGLSTLVKSPCLGVQTNTRVGRWLSWLCWGVKVRGRGALSSVEAPSANPIASPTFWTWPGLRVRAFFNQVCCSEVGDDILEKLIFAAGRYAGRGAAAKAGAAESCFEPLRRDNRPCAQRSAWTSARTQKALTDIRLSNISALRFSMIGLFTTS